MTLRGTTMATFASASRRDDRRIRGDAARCPPRWLTGKFPFKRGASRARSRTSSAPPSTRSRTQRSTAIFARAHLPVDLYTGYRYGEMFYRYQMEAAGDAVYYLHLGRNALSAPSHFSQRASSRRSSHRRNWKICACNCSRIFSSIRSMRSRRSCTKTSAKPIACSRKSATTCVWCWPRAAQKRFRSTKNCAWSACTLTS